MVSSVLTKCTKVFKTQSKRPSGVSKDYIYITTPPQARSSSHGLLGTSSSALTLFSLASCLVLERPLKTKTIINIQNREVTHKKQGKTGRKCTKVRERVKGKNEAVFLQSLAS